MKLIYCMCSIYNPGGMERVLLNKVTYLKARTNWDLVVVTTDQKDRPPFYPFPEGVKMIDLGINYSDDNVLSPWQKITGYLKKRKLHRQRLTALLMQEKADAVVSLYPSESSFLPDIPDGSKKVLELHFNKFFRLQYGRHGILGWIDRFRTWQDERLVRRFDKFVVLSEEDKGYWGELPNMVAIPNAALFMAKEYADSTMHRVIAVGRLDFQKGFDRLIEVWKKVMAYPGFEDWRLDIFGQGEWKDMLEQRIAQYGLTASCKVNAPTKDIAKEYANSSILVMSSNYEGFPMVMIEGMACGLPAVSFDFKCGPKDIIQSGENGLIVPNGDLDGLADALMQLMGNDALRKQMSEKAKDVVKIYSEERVMKMWMDLFADLGLR